MQISQNWNNLSMTAAWGSNIASLYPGQRGRELMWTQKGTPTPRLQPQSPYLRHQLSLRVSPSMKATDGRSDLSWALLTNKVRRLSWLSLLAQGQHSLGTQNKSVFWRHPDARINILSIYSPTKQSWSPPGQATRKPQWGRQSTPPSGTQQPLREGWWATGRWGNQSCGKTPGSGFLFLCHSTRRPKGRVGGTVTQLGMSTWTARCQGYQGRIPPCVSERDSYFQVPLISGCSSLTARTQHSVVSTGSKSARVPACVLFPLSECWEGLRQFYVFIYTF